MRRGIRGCARIAAVALLAVVAGLALAEEAGELLQHVDDAIRTVLPVDPSDALVNIV